MRVAGCASPYRFMGALLFSLLLTPLATAATFTSVQSGDWSSPSTWGVASVPGAGDTVSINPGHTVTGTMTAASVSIAGAATLQPADGSSLGIVSATGLLSPVPGAVVTVTALTVVSPSAFASNGGTIVFAAAAPTALPGLTFDNLRIANGAQLTLSFAMATVNATLTLDGSLTLSGNAVLQARDLNAGAVSSMSLVTGTQLRLMGNFTSFNANLPFGPPSTIAAGTVVFDGSTPQTLTSDLFIPNVQVGFNSSVTTLSGRLRTNSVTVAGGATLQPADGSQFGSLQVTGGLLTPAPGASFTTAGWSVGTGSFTPGGGTVIFGLPSWTTTPTSFNLNGALNFDNVTIPLGMTVTPNGNPTISNTLRLDGTLRATGPLQVTNLVAGALSSFVFNGSQPLRISGDLTTTAGSNAPFGVPDAAAAMTNLTFNGASSQTIVGNPFIPGFIVGDSSNPTVVSGVVRTNSASVQTAATFKPGDGSELGTLNSSGGSSVAPASGATITANGWNVAGFTANGGTVVFGHTSWGTTASSISLGSILTFANVTVGNGITLNAFAPLTAPGTLTVNGALALSSGGQVGNVMAGASSSITFSNGSPLNISGNLTSLSPSAPFGTPAIGITMPIQFNGTSTQTISNDLFIPSFTVLAGATVTGRIRANVVNVNGTFQPADGSQFGTLTGNPGSSITPVTSASMRVGGWNVASFTPNGGTVVFGLTSWGAGSASFNTGSTLTFASLTVASGESVSTFGSLNVRGTLTLDGALSASGGGQIGNLVADSGSTLVLSSGFLRISGNYTANDPAAPFGAPNASAFPTNLQFNGATPQTISGNPFIPGFGVGDGTMTVSLSGTVRANSVSLSPNATFAPGSGSEIGTVNSGGGTLAPSASAMLTVGGWNVTAFTANGSTVTLGKTSWGAGNDTFVSGSSTTFANLIIPTTSSITFVASITSTSTVTVNGTLGITNTMQANDLVAGVSSSITISGSGLRIKGNLTTLGTSAPFGAATAGTFSNVFFNGTTPQTVIGNPFIPSFTAGDGTTTTTVAGKVRANAVNVSVNAVFQPADGSEIGSLLMGGSFTPASGATVTLGLWNGGSFTANGGTLILGKTSWGAGNPSMSIVYGSPVFHHLTVAQGMIVFMAVNAVVDGTLDLEGTLQTQQQVDVKDVVAGSSASLQLAGNLFRVSGDFTAANGNVPFGPAVSGPTTPLVFIATGTQTIHGNPYFPSFTIGDGSVGRATTVAGAVRANLVTVASPDATFQPGDGAEVAALQASTGIVRPANGAAVTISSAILTTFDLSGANLAVGSTSWGAGTANTQFLIPNGPALAVANLTVPLHAAFSFANSNGGNALTVSGTLRLDGTLTPSSTSGLINQFHDVAAGSGALLYLSSGNTTRISGNVTAASLDAPFGPATTTGTSTPLVFNGTLPQTITDGLFIPSFTVGTGSTPTTLSGRIRANVVTVASNAILQPADQSEFGSLSGAGAIAPAAGASLYVSTSWSASNFQTNGNTVLFGPNSWITNPNVSVNGPTTFGDVAIRSTAVVTGNAGTISLTGKLTVDGMLQSGAFTFAGTAPETIGGTGTFTPNALTVNNVQGVTASLDITVTGMLNLTLGKLSTMQKVIMGSSAAVTRGSGWVSGTLRKPTSLGVPATFEVGGASAYSPVRITPNSGTPSVIDVRATEDPHPVPLGTNALHRYWTIAAPGVTNADLQLNYNPADVSGTEGNLRLVEFTGGAWSSLGTVANTTLHQVVFTGATTFGDFGLAPPAAALAFGPINGGVAPRATVPFPVVIRAVDADGGSVVVLTATDVDLSLDPSNAGSGSLAGTLAATIPASASSVTLNDITYSTTSSGVRLRAARGASGESLATGFSNPLTFLSLAANHLGIVAPSSATAGAPFNVTVAALDTNGVVDSGYRGTVHFTTSDPLGSALADYTFTAGDLGTHTFAITLQSSGAQSFSFVDLATSSIQASASVTISKATTTTTLVASPNLSIYSQNVTLTATVAPVAPASVVPQGTVTFLDGTTALATVPLSSGSASFGIATLAGGSHSLTASYDGSSIYNGSTSAAVSEVVNASPTTTALGTTPNPSVFGESVSFSVNVAASGAGGGIPSGTVTLFEGATSLGSAALDGTGHATIPLSSLAIGPHSLAASYASTASHAASTSPVVVQNIGRANSAVALVALNPSSTFGDSVSFQATVSAVAPGAGLPTGSVEFFDGTTSLGNATVDGAGKASKTISTLAVATHSITAVYLGDGNFNGATSSAVSQSVAKSTPSASLVSSATPSSFGQPVTLTATLASAAGTPSGTVTFTEGATVLTVATLSSGLTTYTTSSLTLGAHAITATYGGDGSFNGAAASTTQNVDVTSTGVAVTASPSSSSFGENVTFTATVTPTTAITPTGNVVFKEGTTTLATSALTAGVATFQTADLTAGSHSIVAAYAGDTNNSAASGSLTFTVAHASSTTTITSSATPSLFGQSVTFTIQVIPATSGTPSGSVTLSEGANTIATVPVAGGMATFAIASLGVGTHTITAMYSGDANFDPSSGNTQQVVQQATPSLAVVSSGSTSTFGQSVTFTATLTATSGTPTGTIRFVDGSTDLGMVGVSGDSAAFTTSALTSGSHSIAAVYSGDASFASATSPALNQTVAAATTAVAFLSSANPSSFGDSITFTATVSSTGGTPTGSITFQSDTTPLGTITLSGGAAQVTVSTLTVATHLLSATYSGDTNYQASSATLSQVVNTTPTTISLASSTNPAPFGTSLTLTATVASTVTLDGGTVTFFEGSTPLTTLPLSGNSVSYSIGAARTPATYSFHASYSGTATHAASSSASLSQVVDPVSTSVVVTSSSNPGAVGAPIQFTATVTSTTGPTPTGSVAFFDGSTSIGSGTLSAGVATYTTSSLSAGPHAITAVYTGDTDFLGSTSPALSQTLGVTVTISSIAPQAACQASGPITLTVHGSGFDATTRVEWDGATRTTTLVDGGSVTIELTPADLASARSVTVGLRDAGNNTVANAQTFTIDADVTGPVVIVPLPITVAQSACSAGSPGARGVDLPALSMFLRAATATDGCSSAFSLAPQVNGLDVDDNTLFAGGATDVTFRFVDGAGNVTPATSRVTVQLFGDLTGDGSLDATDRLILENYLVGNLQQGTAPFTAPMTAADLNHDGNVDATDSLLLANVLVGNITCLTSSSVVAPLHADGHVVQRRRLVGPPARSAIIPVMIDLTAVYDGEQPATLGSYVARLTFDPARVAVESVSGGTTSQFAVTPAATALAEANRGGVLRISGVQLDANAPIGLCDVAHVLFVEIAPGGLTSVQVRIESVAHSLASISSGTAGRSH